MKTCENHWKSDKIYRRLEILYRNDNLYKNETSIENYFLVFENSTFMLMEGVKELDNLYGIVMYSMFQLPEKESDRKYILNLVIRKKKL